MPTDAEIYGYGTLANILCCLCSLGGAFVLPCARKHHNAYHVILSVFMGLAVGTLASDALLHLLPEALSLHDHNEEGEDHMANDTHHDDHDDHDDHGEDIHVEPYVWYCLIVLTGIYAFYILEVIMATLHARGTTAKTDIMDGVGNGFSEQKPETFRKLDENHQTSSTMETQKEEKETQNHYVKPIVVMIVIGDAIHNFTDGLAVAASFNSSIVEGVSTSLAIICHELPQELGDFAILMQNGLSFKEALIANLLSSLTALLGFFIGVSLSKDAGASQWIFSIAAGLFLYISLVDMIPELIRTGAGRLRTIIYHNIGIVIGILIILLLSIFEDKIHI
ncbi:zinc transporter ZIP4-like [Mizuhopecten yessoensis]|uniref:Zinc transporter ZIP4 n=1 Tax=Mizuhopecten yessoensis TaxID=6573 RepID=A0A210PVC8_MIZYE|nr:zinc transporter ZIP4-like [Mizuhopecten yessoensis]XP_021374386.1 zinc transporter ZIP4-like [Mizuhopecten yessoensis]OWF40412.1 Zinc transporter ZIP4 [Mizuhopecten yessoensis]